MSGCSSQGPATQVIFSGIFVQPFFIVCIVFIIVPARWLYWRFVFARQFPRHQAANSLALGSGERQSFVRVAARQVSAVAAYPLCLTDRLNPRLQASSSQQFVQDSAQVFSGQEPACKNRAGRLLPSTAPSTVSTSSLRASSPSLRRVSLRNSSLRPSLPSTPRIIETSPQQGQEEWVKTTSPLISSSSTVSEVTSGPSAGTLYLVYLFSEGPTFGQPKCIMCHFMSLNI